VTALSHFICFVTPGAFADLRESSRASLTPMQCTDSTWQNKRRKVVRVKTVVIRSLESSATEDELLTKGNKLTRPFAGAQFRSQFAVGPILTHFSWNLNPENNEWEVVKGMS
jgi:hypothetical protein